MCATRGVAVRVSRGVAVRPQRRTTSVGVRACGADAPHSTAKMSKKRRVLTHIVRECVCVKRFIFLSYVSKRVKSYNGSGTVARTRHTDWRSCFVTDTVSGDITHRITQVYPAQFRFRYTGYTSPIYRDPTQTVLVNRDRLHATPSVPVL